MLRQGASSFLQGSLPVPAHSLESLTADRVSPVSDFPLGSDSDDVEPRYPGKRPQGSFVVHQGLVYPVKPSATGWTVTVDSSPRGPTLVDLDVWLRSLGQTPVGTRLASVGYGSNLNPGEIAIFSQKTATVVLRAAVVGLQAVYLSRPRSRDGQFPAGLTYATPQHVEMHGIVLIDPDRMDDLDAKEGQGGPYVRSAITGPGSIAAVLEDGTMLSSPLPAYVQQNKRVALHKGVPLRLCDIEQRQFAERAASGVIAPSSHSWIESMPLDRLTPLSTRPIPYFVYGTLRPGQSRWPGISHLVSRATKCSIYGRRFDTGNGYPGLHIQGHEAVDGFLLDPAPGRVHELKGLLDGIEGHPDLFTRTLVRLCDGELAWTYVWNGSSQ